LLEHGQNVVVVDNLYNASYEAIRRIEQITGKKVHFFKCDILDLDGLRKIFKKFDVWSVIHFAGLKAVGESTQIPLAYYRNSITGTLNLLQAMNETNVKNFVFSSSATVYGNPPVIPIPETSPIVSAFLSLLAQSWSSSQSPRIRILMIIMVIGFY
jgi:UDP-glucose 4-epimerase